jgi:hypothetical protein
MPKLLLFAACEQIIIDLSNTISLLKLLQEVTVQVPAGVTPPPNAGAPLQWHIISVFEQEQADQNKKFEQYCGLIANSGQILLQSPISLFELKADQHRITSPVAGMPVGIVGKHHLKCFIREKGTTQWKECASYPITIKWATNISPAPN